MVAKKKKEKSDHFHRPIPMHSEAQGAMFFALGAELGHSQDDLKEHAKTKFEKDCFQKITNSEMQYLIDRLQAQKELREKLQKGGKDANNTREQESGSEKPGLIE